MTGKTKKLIIFSILGALVLPLFFSVAVLAVSSPDSSINSSQPVQGLSLSPFIFEDSAQKGQVVEHQIQLSNNSPETLIISAATADFKAGNDTGQPLFLAPGEAGNPTYSLSLWVKMSNVPAHLLPGQKQLVAVKISVPLNAEDGTHYGAILFSYNTANNQSGAGADIIKKAGTLFFLKVGAANEQGNIKNFSGKNIFLNSSAFFNTTFENTGNVHLKPKGQMEIRNIFGQLVGSVQVNRDAQIVLPQTFRSFGSQWHSFFPFGWYIATAHLYYGDSNLEAISKISFWIFPLQQILLTIILIAIFALALIFGIRKYNQWIVKKHFDETL